MTDRKHHLYIGAHIGGAVYVQPVLGAKVQLDTVVHVDESQAGGFVRDLSGTLTVLQAVVNLSKLFWLHSPAVVHDVNEEMLICCLYINFDYSSGGVRIYAMVQGIFH